MFRFAFYTFLELFAVFTPRFTKLVVQAKIMDAEAPTPPVLFGPINVLEKPATACSVTT